jgi:hypothetical protein
VNTNSIDDQKWEQIIAIEPQIKFILEEAQNIKDDPDEESFCANDHFHGQGGLKEQLSGYVGYWAKNPRLKSSDYYDVVYRKVHQALPNCRNCICL